MTKEQELLFLLKGHGFHTAASQLNLRDVGSIAGAVTLWAEYPQCMSKFPKVIKKKPAYQ